MDDMTLLQKVLEHRLFHMNNYLYTFLREMEKYSSDSRYILSPQYLYEQYRRHLEENSYYKSLLRSYNINSNIEKMRDVVELAMYIKDKYDHRFFYETHKELLTITEKEISLHLNLSIQEVKNIIKKIPIKKVRKNIYRDDYFYKDKLFINKGYCLFELCKNSEFFTENLLSVDFEEDIDLVFSKLKEIGTSKQRGISESRYVWKRDYSLRVELDCLNIIEKHLNKLLGDIIFIRQKTIFINSNKWYRVDLYIPKYNIAIECDEPNTHSGAVNKYADNYREQEIIERLKCKFIRFNPYDKEFNPFVVADNIYHFIQNKNGVLLHEDGTMSNISDSKYKELRKFLYLLNGYVWNIGGELLNSFEQKCIYEKILDIPITMYDFKRACIEEGVYSDVFYVDFIRCDYNL